MRLVYDWLLPAMWLGYLAYWAALAGKVKAAEVREPAASRLVRTVVLAGAVALLWLPRLPFLRLDERFLPLSAWCFWAGSAITAVGLLFSVRARRYLGQNWSQAVTVKEDHELITTGPYALVRHPIYVGLLLGFGGCAVARGEWRGLLALVLVLAVLWRKLHLEETWMRARFGQSYEDYARRVAALVPHPWPPRRPTRR